MPYRDSAERKAYQKDYQRKWIAARRAAWFAANGPCVKCGSDVEMHVDHVDPTIKSFNIVWSWSASRLEPELAKCQVLCRRCHEAKTAAENSARNGGLRHGTDTMYGKCKCRCELCREARRIAKKANRARRKALGLPHQ